MIDQIAAQTAIRDFLAAVGLDPDDAVLRGTPGRVAQAATELFAGVGANAQKLFAHTLAAQSHDLVAMTDISVRSVCAHHLLPMYGSAAVAYLPENRIVGLSTVPHLVEMLASRPQVQETLTAQIADELMAGIAARGVLVSLRLHQDCVSARGVRQTHAQTVTIAARGELDHVSGRELAFAAFAQAASVQGAPASSGAAQAGDVSDV